jgi:hypothetical protein
MEVAHRQQEVEQNRQESTVQQDAAINITAVDNFI